jgi:hypothetical protein
MSAQEKSWPPEEYPDMREEELARMKAKSEHYRVAETFGMSAEEAALMRIRAMMAAHEEAAT